MSGSEDSGTGRLVATSGLDTNEPVLDNVDPADTVGSGESVERKEDLDGVGDGLVLGRDRDRGGDTLGEGDGDVLSLLGGVLRVDSQLPHVTRRGLVRVLEDTGLVRDVEEVLVCERKTAEQSKRAVRKTTGSGQLTISAQTKRHRVTFRKNAILTGRPRLGSGLNNGDTLLSGVSKEGGSSRESVVED